MDKMCRMYAFSSLISLAYLSTSYGLVYRTGCCPKPELIPDTAKRTADFIEGFGYRVEIHEVVTEDGYIVTMHRIEPWSSDFIDKPAVIIQHGIASASSHWLMNQERSLPLLLFEAGFDVWLLDTRGNSYSRKHVTLRTSDSNYWNFSFHEQGTLDLAAATDYVLDLTQNEKIFYIGHSRGTTMALALLSTRPEYNDKFHLVSLFAPVAYIKHWNNPLIRIIFNGPFLPTVENLVKSLGAYIVPGSSDASIQFREIFCNRTSLACIDVIFAFAGYDYELLNKSMIPVYVSHYPEGGAIREYIHYLQIATTDLFRLYDHGPELNNKVYGSSSPPFYDLSKITAPISLHYGDNDFLVRPQDRNRLRKQLKSVVANVRVPFKKFNHFDFLFATKADIYLYKPTIQLMKKFLPS